MKMVLRGAREDEEVLWIEMKGRFEVMVAVSKEGGRGEEQEKRRTGKEVR